MWRVDWQPLTLLLICECLDCATAESHWLHHSLGEKHWGNLQPDECQLWLQKSVSVGKPCLAFSNFLLGLVPQFISEFSFISNLASGDHIGLFQASFYSRPSKTLGQSQGTHSTEALLTKRVGRYALLQGSLGSPQEIVKFLWSSLAIKIF